MSSTLLNFTMKHIQKQQQKFIELLKEKVDDYHTWNNVDCKYKYADPNWYDEVINESESEYESDIGSEADISDEYGNIAVILDFTKKYKFRPECAIDVMHFAKELERKNIPFYMKSVYDGWELQVKSTYTFTEIIRVANETDDCHVIVDTFEYKENYTGERKYRCGNIENIEMPE